MNIQSPRGCRLSRRAALRAGAGAALGVVAMPLRPRSAGAAPRTAPTADGYPAGTGNIDDRIRELDAKIGAAMEADGIPGVAIGLIAGDREYVRGYGITNVDYPVPVDGDTVFRIQSSTKTFTGTAIMRLVEQGKVDLDAAVRTYLPDFVTADKSAAAQVTVRQLLNHSAGWLGEDYIDTGPGDDAVARYVAAMEDLPQLTPPGRVFGYNNAAMVVAGRIIEVVTGSAYEDAVKSLLLDPLGLSHSSFFSDEIVGFNVAAPHKLVAGKPVVETSYWRVPRSNNPTGGLISSARDQIHFARFHLGDGTADDGTPLLSPQSLAAMRSNPGPGGTLIVELIGMGVNWMLRPSAEGELIVQHGGGGPGQFSGFIMVPSRGFALTVLTNSDGASQLLSELFTNDWALRRFAGVTNIRAVPRELSAAELAPYEGRYLGYLVDDKGVKVEIPMELRRQEGRLQGTVTSEGTSSEFGLQFYDRDYALILSADGQPLGSRADFLRGPDGRVVWLRRTGRLWAHKD
jgi:CubicO group peptidase (beta-lactamase class C family)